MYLERKGKKNNNSNLRNRNKVKYLFSILTEKSEKKEVNHGKDQPHSREYV